MRRALAVVAASGALALAACADDSATAPTSSAPAATTTSTTPAPTSAAPTTTASSGAASTTSVAPATSSTAPTAAAPDLASVKVRLTEVARIDQPIDLVVRPGTTDLYVASRTGRVFIWRGGEPSREVAVDLHARTRAEGERGLLGIAVRDDEIFVHYTDRGGTTNLDALRLGPDGIADAGSRRNLLTQAQPFANHNGGSLVVGPDRMLYLALGDGGSAGDPGNRAQDLTTLLGKILRIDPAPNGSAPYSIPPDNPFVDRAGARGEIWSYGLRNPWRIAFDPANGDLWIGDVGQNEVEEIDHAPATTGAGRGVNFGWRRFEGTAVYSSSTSADGAVDPIATWTHSGDGGCSITGGRVARGSGITGLDGAYVTTDLCWDHLVAVDPANPSNLVRLVDAPNQVVSFGADARGRLYALVLSTGQVLRLDPA